MQPAVAYNWLPVRGSSMGGTSAVGQGGVGLYPFHLLPDKVRVISEARGDEQSVWEPSAGDSHTVRKDTALVHGEITFGAKVIYYFKEDQCEFVEERRIKAVVKKPDTIRDLYESSTITSASVDRGSSREGDPAIPNTHADLGRKGWRTAMRSGDELGQTWEFNAQNPSSRHPGGDRGRLPPTSRSCDAVDRRAATCRSRPRWSAGHGQRGLFRSAPGVLSHWRRTHQRRGASSRDDELG